MPLAHSRLATAALALVVAALDISPASAALPPYWQSAREIEAILQDPAVHDAFKYEEPILSISTTGNDVYMIKTPRCTLDVTIVTRANAPAVAGPRQFDIEIGTANCQ